MCKDYYFINQRGLNGLIVINRGSFGVMTATVHFKGWNQCGRPRERARLGDIKILYIPNRIPTFGRESMNQHLRARIQEESGRIVPRDGSGDEPRGKTWAVVVEAAD